MIDELPHDVKGPPMDLRIIRAFVEHLSDLLSIDLSKTTVEVEFKGNTVDAKTVQQALNGLEALFN